MPALYAHTVAAADLPGAHADGPPAELHAVVEAAAAAAAEAGGSGPVVRQILLNLLVVQRFQRVAVCASGVDAVPRGRRAYVYGARGAAEPLLL